MAPLCVMLAGSVFTAMASVFIAPGTNIQSVVNANPAGTTFILQSGTFRMQSVVPKNGDVFTGQSGAILNGSTLVSAFSEEVINGVRYWVADGPRQPGRTNGTCDSAHPMCMYPEDFLMNSKPLLRVASLSAVTSGACYFDYGAARVYFTDSPTGKTVEISTMTDAFSGSASGVVIKGLTIEKYASPAQDGAIQGSGWTIESNTIRLNHGAGIQLASGQVIVSNYIHHNGQEGLTGGGSNILVENNEIAYNNTLGFSFDWEAGGAKFANSTNVTVEGNYVHDNAGPGLSLDYQCYNWIVQGNRTSRNIGAGIVDEVSYDGIARYNVITNHALYPGKTNPSMWWSCGIANLASPNARVYGNTLINNTNGICAISNSRGSGNRGTFQVQNYSVHDNVIVQTTGGAAGAVADPGIYMDVYAPSMNNTWTSNTYKLSGTAVGGYTWESGSKYANLTAPQWQSAHQDLSGTWISSTDSNFPSTRFAPLAAVKAVASTPVRFLPTATSAIVKTEASGATGTVTQVAGPILTSAAWWWNVTFSDGTRGWCLETSLAPR
ncbi:MAG TPA: right-handed parallel beta-helix repeat-containing protein [Bryobacteraceae bacterium]|nr:right-handed parallel beta-helix repeat-containing protein [Bryobacteraceae bacterium]